MVYVGGCLAGKWVEPTYLIPTQYTLNQIAFFCKYFVNIDIRFPILASFGKYCRRLDTTWNPSIWSHPNTLYMLLCNYDCKYLMSPPTLVLGQNFYPRLSPFAWFHLNSTFSNQGLPSFFTFPHCAFSNVSSNGLPAKRHSCIGCIC